MKIRQLVLIGLLILLSAMQLRAQEQSSFDPVKPLSFDASFVRGELANGIKYYIKVNPNPKNRVSFQLVVNAGSLQEDDDQQGLAHFTEHMLFNGSKNFSREELNRYLDSIGMGFEAGLNAYTTFEHTAYNLSAPSDDPEKLRKAFIILSDWASNASFLPQELEKERKVIIEEWRMGQGWSERISQKTDPVVMKGSRYVERFPIGKYEVISSFERDTILRFYKDWYRPDLQEVLIVGDVVPEQMISLLKEYFEPLPVHPNPRPRLDYDIPLQNEPVAVVATDPEAPYSYLTLYWLHPPRKYETQADFLVYFKNGLVSQMLSRRLEEISKQANAPFSMAFAYRADMSKTRSAYQIMAFSSQDKMLAATQTILAEVQRAKQHGFTSGEMNRALQRMLRQAENSMMEKDNELTEEIAWEYLAAITEDTVILDPEENFRLMNAVAGLVSLEELNGIFKGLTGVPNFAIEVVGTEKAGVIYPTEQELLTVYEASQEMEMEPYLDKVGDEPFIDKIPQPVRILKEKVHAKAGIKEWKLKNGITIFSKKTDFKQDEVLFKASSKGGYSLLPPEDAYTAMNAGYIISESGFGEFDGQTIRQMNSGKKVYVSPYIDLYYEGFDGQCSPKDMETMFQMLYQYINKPRKSVVSFEAAIGLLNSFAQNREQNPDIRFADSLQVIHHSYHPYMRVWQAKDLYEIDIHWVYEIYAQRFADWSDFNFYFVGNFDEDQLRAFCETYLANLPVSKRKETWKDVGIRSPKGKIERTIHLGMDDKAMVSLYTHGKAVKSFKQRIWVSAFGLLLNNKLRENVRERLGGTYDIRANGDLENVPFSQYWIPIQLECAVDRKDELIEASLAVLDELKAGKITEEDLTFVRNTLLMEFEQFFISNNRWLYGMQRFHTMGHKIDEFALLPDIIKALRVKDLQYIAKKTLNHRKDLIKVTRLPEKQEEKTKP